MRYGKKRHTLQEIADHFGARLQAIHQRLRQFFNILKNSYQARAYDQKRAQILKVIEFELVKDLLDKKKLKKATFALELTWLFVSLKRKREIPSQE